VAEQVLHLPRPSDDPNLCSGCRCMLQHRPSDDPNLCSGCYCLSAQYPARSIWMPTTSKPLPNKMNAIPVQVQPFRSGCEHVIRCMPSSAAPTFICSSLQVAYCLHTMGQLAACVALFMYVTQSADVMFFLQASPKQAAESHKAGHGGLRPIGTECWHLLALCCMHRRSRSRLTLCTAHRYK
jgi:hypothetical protein